MRADPRPSNHGGHTPTPPPHPAPLGAGLGSRFDWYDATADGLDDGRVAPALALALGGRITAGKPRNGYAHAEVVQRGEDVLATVYGGSARAGEVHISITSEACDDAVPVVRRLWPAHRVSRADAAVDVLADFEQLDARTVAFAEDRRLQHRSFRNSEGGATRYVGSPASELMLRVYKKSEQLRALHPERADEIPPGIVRFELVARPGRRDAKERAAALAPDDVWGLGKWSREYAAEVLSIAAERTATHFRRPSDWSRALHFLGLQYAPSVARRVADVGRDAAVLEVLEALGLDS